METSPKKATLSNLQISLPVTASHSSGCEIVQLAAYLSHSEEIKYIAENSLSIGETGDILKKKPKKPNCEKRVISS